MGWGEEAGPNRSAITRHPVQPLRPWDHIDERDARDGRGLVGQSSACGTFKLNVRRPPLERPRPVGETRLGLTARQITRHPVQPLRPWCYIDERDARDRHGPVGQASACRTFKLNVRRPPLARLRPVGETRLGRTAQRSRDIQSSLFARGATSMHGTHAMGTALWDNLQPVARSS